MDTKNLNVLADNVTDEQAKMLYDTLGKVENKDVEALKKAKEMTDNCDYEEIAIKEMTEDEMREAGLAEDSIRDLKDIKLSPEELVINETADDYRDTLSYYDVSDNEIEGLIEVIQKYKAGVNMNYYNALPKGIQIICDSMAPMNGGNKNVAAKFMLKSLVSDAKYGAAVEEYKTKINSVMDDTDKDFKNLMDGSINKVFDDIDKIREEDPEKAEKIEKIRKAFDDAKVYQKELDAIAAGYNDKKLAKLVNRFDGECMYFNKKVNSNALGLVIPDISKMYSIIKKALDGFTEIQIKKFILLIIKNSYNINTDDIAEMAYIYRAVDNVLSFGYSTSFESDRAKEVFEAIRVAIGKMINSNSKGVDMDAR